MKIPDLAIVTNTNSVNKDLWSVHRMQIQRYMTEPHYVFSDEFDESIQVNKFIPYDSKLKFRSQFLSCIEQVEEKFCLYLNEDYLFYDAPDLDKLQEYVSVLQNNECFSFIRLAKGIDLFKIPISSTLNYLDSRNPYFFSQTASLWRTEHLMAVHAQGPDLHIAGNDMSQQFEVAATDVCRTLGIQGLYHYDGESKRGEYHYDSKIFPYTASALVKGEWNFKEYEKELKDLGRQYRMSFKKRGIYQ